MSSKHISLNLSNCFELLQYILWKVHYPFLWYQCIFWKLQITMFIILISRCALSVWCRLSTGRSINFIFMGNMMETCMLREVRSKFIWSLDRSTMMWRSIHSINLIEQQRSSQSRSSSMKRKPSMGTLLCHIYIYTYIYCIRCIYTIYIYTYMEYIYI